MSFPRTILPNRVSPFRVPTGLVAAGQTGKDQLRAIAAMGREWTESFPPIRMGSPDTDALIAYIEDAYNQRKTFTIKHLITPGSGLPPNGTGGGTPVVSGGSQTGQSLLTSGWSSSITNVVRAGDVIRIAGLSMLFRLTADASSNGSGVATLTVSPPIYSSPAGGAAITRADCTLTAYIAEPPVLPSVPPGQYLAGLTLTFREALS